ncbi:MAG: hypothetical protein BWY72_01232 [Bacteroidetes bacterium ADurb.Bin416]|nr:MAG: hypothetical protein BWY72_01232 [Bacteroidetes bacterium ADurb.Bin416]
MDGCAVTAVLALTFSDSSATAFGGAGFAFLLMASISILPTCLMCGLKSASLSSSTSAVGVGGTAGAGVGVGTTTGAGVGCGSTFVSTTGAASSSVLGAPSAARRRSLFKRSCTRLSACFLSVISWLNAVTNISYSSSVIFVLGLFSTT